MFICLDTFWTNPQFSISITEINRACEPIPKKGLNTLVSLMQMPDKRNRRLTRNLYIGFCIFKASENCQTSLYFKYDYLPCLCSHSSSLYIFFQRPQEVCFL